METTDNLVVGHKCDGDRYVGVIRRGKKVVWTCPHRHVNRDQTTSHATAARDCASRVLEVIRNDDQELGAFEKWIRSGGGRYRDRETRTHEILKWALEEGRKIRGSVHGC